MNTPTQTLTDTLDDLAMPPLQTPVDYLTNTPEGIRRVTHDANGNALIRKYADLSIDELRDLQDEAQEACYNLWQMKLDGRETPDLADRYSVWADQYGLVMAELMHRADFRRRR